MEEEKEGDNSNLSPVFLFYFSQNKGRFVFSFYNNKENLHPVLSVTRIQNLYIQLNVNLIQDFTCSSEHFYS